MAPVHLFVSLLAPVPAHLGHGHSVDPNLDQRFLHFFQLEWLDDGFYLFHDRSFPYASKLYPSSPCMLRSSPWISCSRVRRTPHTTSQIFRMIRVPTIAKPHEIRQPRSWFTSWPPLPSTSPSAVCPVGAGATATVAKMPVR